jgi:NAD-dependent deacetylase
MLKSATISFGQSLVQEQLVRSERAARSCDLLLAVGSTLSVYPIAEVVPLAKRSGAKLVIVNGDPTVMDEIADAVVNARIGDVLPSLVAPAPS